MTTSDMIRALCEKQNISLGELCRRIGYEQAFVLTDGEKIGIEYRRST